MTGKYRETTATQKVAINHSYIPADIHPRSRGMLLVVRQTVLPTELYGYPLHETPNSGNELSPKLMPQPSYKILFTYFDTVSVSQSSLLPKLLVSTRLSPLWFIFAKNALKSRLFKWSVCVISLTGFSALSSKVWLEL